MIETITTFYDQNQATLNLVAGLSVLMLVASILSLPWLVALIPTDYFRHEQPYRLHHRFRHPLLRLLILVVKNLLGWMLIVVGIILLVLPGQGLITLVLGLVLIDFPGKRAVECRLVSDQRVLRAINWLRAKRKREPLLAPQRDAPV